MTATSQRHFTHTEPGTPETVWLRDPRWSEAPLVDLAATVARYDEIVVAAAHPDDESLAVGGFVAAAARLGASLRVVVATRGEASHPRAAAWTPARLAEVRAAEVEAAVARLAPRARVEHLGFPDGGLEGAEAALADALTDRCGPGTLVVAPCRGDGHPDHDTLGRAAVTAAARTGARTAHYPLWLWHWGAPDDLPWPRAHVVEPTLADHQRKQAALEEYPSQSLPLGPTAGDAPVLTDAVLARAYRLVEVLLAEEGVLAVRAPRGADGVAEPFDAMFATGSDPWGFHGSFYERRKRALTTAVLAREHYCHVVEIGCATGVLTRALAERAGRVTAVDVSAAALAEARRDAPGHVQWVLGQVPSAVPAASADLVVLSEVGYFLTPTELIETLRRVRRPAGRRRRGGPRPLAAPDRARPPRRARGARAGRDGARGPPAPGPVRRRRRPHRRLGWPPVRRRGGGPSVTRVRHVVVAVPARNEERLLGTCLDSVLTAVARLQRHRPGTTAEVVVALDGCVDGSAEVAGRRPVTVLHEDAGAVGPARRAAVTAGLAALAVGDGWEQTWIANTDADCEVPPHWLVDQVALADEGADLVVGTVSPVDVADPRVLGAWLERHELREGHGHVHGANLGVRADAYLAVGGFAPLAVHEDVGLVTRLRDAGHPWVATDRCRVRTSGRTESRVDGGFATFLAGLTAPGGGSALEPA